MAGATAIQTTWSLPMIPAKSLTVPNKEDAVALDSLGTLVPAVGAFIVSPLAECAQRVFWYNLGRLSCLKPGGNQRIHNRSTLAVKLVELQVGTARPGLSNIEDHKP